MSPATHYPWPLERLKSIASVAPSNVDKRTDPTEPAVRLCNYVDVYNNERITGDLPFMEASATREQIARFALHVGDVLITKDSEAPEDIAVPSYVDGSAEGVVCGYHLALLRPKPDRLHGGYLCWALRARPTASQFTARAQGITRFGLTVGAIGDVRVPVPPLAQQRSIAAFLDRKVAQIDALAATQESFLASLEEHRRAVVNHVVVTGLAPTAPMQETGVPSLPHVPAHWTVKPLMRLTPDDRQIMYGIVLPGPDFPGGVPIVKAGNVKPGGLALDNLKRTSPEIEAGYARSRLRSGDLVYAIRGSIGTVEEVPAEAEGANLTQDVARVAPRPDVHGRWLLYALRSSAIFGQLEAGALGAAVQGINIRDLKRARVPVPPPDEQGAIAQHLDAALERVDRLRACGTEMVERLREHRTALITAAVMGRINVRDRSLAEAAE